NTGRRWPRRRHEKLSSGREPTIRSLLYSLQIRHCGRTRAQLALPLSISESVQLQDQCAGILRQIGGVADRDKAAVGGLLDLGDRAARASGEVDVRPGKPPDGVDLLDQSTLDPASRGTQVC